jgi:hypothetical protein
MPVDQIIDLGGFALIAAAFGTLLLPVGVCNECPHCQQIRRIDDAQQRRLQDEYARRWGIKRPEDED